MAAKLKIEKRGDEILIIHCCFSVSQNFNCSYMARSSLTYILLKRAITPKWVMGFTLKLQGV
jgi:hypothetical protein